jgi:pyruvate kinase
MDDFIEKVQVLDIKPGDVVVIKTEHFLVPRQRQTIVDLVASVFPENRVLVLDGGLELEVAREE